MGFCRGFEVSGGLRLSRIGGYSLVGVRLGLVWSFSWSEL